MSHSIDKQRTALEQTKQAALAWWESLRPVDWSLRQHIDNPTVNTASANERRMAEAVAASVECGAI